jgi:hypothetical protein
LTELSLIDNLIDSSANNFSLAVENAPFLQFPVADKVLLKEEIAPDKLILTFSFWSRKESTRIVKKSQLCQHLDAYTGVHSSRPRSDCKPKGETEMSKKQNLTTVKVRKALLGNHNEIALKMGKLGGFVQRHFLRSIKMRKSSMFLIFVMVLASCSSFAQNTQSPSPTPGVSTTQAPSSEVDTSWKTYTNPDIGFSIQYPANWQEQDLPDENEGQRHHIALQGSEGGIELVWGTGLGGACPEGYQPIAVAQGTWPACHAQRDDGTELWSLAGQPIGDTNFTGFVYTNDTTAESREVVLRVLSTLSFPYALQPTLASIVTETPATTTSTGACPSETADLKLFMNADDGYCFLYPKENAALPPKVVVINPNSISGADSHFPGDAVVIVSMEAAPGRTAAQVADERIAEAGEGFNITRTEIMIDGKQAIVVDGLPAQDSSREVFIVGNDRLYILLFESWTPDADWFSELEKLYSSVIASFYVLPPLP